MKKNYLFNLFIFTIVIFGFNGCKKEDDKKENDKKEKLSYKELVSINKISNFSNDVLYYTDSMYLSELSSNNKLKSGDSFYPITLSDMAELVEPILKEYPNFDSLTFQDLEIVEQDFPTLTQSDIETNIDGIELVYDAVGKYKLYQKADSFLRKNIKGKRKSYTNWYPYDLSSQELSLLISHPRLIDGTNMAREQAGRYAQEYFPTLAGWKDKADAFRHTIWNTLIAKHTSKRFTLIGDAVDWAKKFTDAHESGHPGGDENDVAMDYHNNNEGREYFREIATKERVKDYWLAGWHYKNVIRTPENSTIKFEVFWRAIMGAKFFDKSELPNWNGRLVYLVD